MWHGFMAEAGNAPGAQQGDVVVTLLQPVGGVGEVTVPSNDVTIAAEAGNLIGVQVMLPDGRHLFVSAGNLAGMVDAPRAEDKPARRGRQQAGDGDGKSEDGGDGKSADDPERKPGK
jgi:hypothetical protein